MTKIAVCFGYPVVDNAAGNAATATLHFCLDEREISERHRQRGKNRSTFSERTYPAGIACR